PYNGGIALIVKSKEERDKEKEAERLAKLPPPKPPPYKKNGDVVQDVNVTELHAKLQKKQDQDGDLQTINTAPKQEAPKDDAPKQDAPKPPPPTPTPAPKK